MSSATVPDIASIWISGSVYLGLGVGDASWLVSEDVFCLIGARNLVRVEIVIGSLGLGSTS